MVYWSYIWYNELKMFNFVSKRFIYIDVLRFVAIFLVILLHSSSDFVWNFSNTNVVNWLFVNSFYSLSAIGVPIFVMISGMLLLSKKGNIAFEEFFKKQFMKVFVPFFAWSVFYVFYSHNFQLNGITLDSIASPAYYHLWFTYMLFGLYLLFPFIRLVFHSAAENSRYRYFLAIWFFIFSLAPIFCRIAGVEIPTIWFLRDNIFSFLWYFVFAYSGYFVLGYYLENIKLGIFSKKTTYFLSLISFLVTVFGSYFLTIKNGGNLDIVLYSELSPNIVIMSVSFFILFKDIKWEKLLSKRLLLFLESFGLLCYGIYLSHPLILDKLRELKIFNELSFGWLLLSVFCLIISYVFCLVISKVKILNNLLISFIYQRKNDID